jgi:hypothetical protein
MGRKKNNKVPQMRVQTTLPNFQQRKWTTVILTPASSTPGVINGTDLFLQIQAQLGFTIAAANQFRAKILWFRASTQKATPGATDTTALVVRPYNLMSGLSELPKESWGTISDRPQIFHRYNRFDQAKIIALTSSTTTKLCDFSTDTAEEVVPEFRVCIKYMIAADTVTVTQAATLPQPIPMI